MDYLWHLASIRKNVIGCWGDVQKPEKTHANCDLQVCFFHQISFKTYLFIYLPIFLSIYLAIHLSIHPFDCLCIYLSINRSISLCFYLPTYFYIYIFIFVFVYIHIYSFSYIYNVYTYVFIVIYLVATLKKCSRSSVFCISQNGESIGQTSVQDIVAMKNYEKQCQHQCSANKTVMW